MQLSNLPKKNIATKSIKSYGLSIYAKNQKKIWQDIQYSCCADCHKIVPSKLAYDQYTYPPFKERKRLYEEKIKNSDYEPDWDKAFNNELFKFLND